MKILFAASECVPFVKTGGLADVVGSLAPVLANMGHDVRVIIPKYAAIDESFESKMNHAVDFEVQLGWRRQYCGIETLVQQGVTFYFVDNRYYFGRNYIYGMGGDEYERYAFFSRAVLNCLPLLDFWPDILHAHDWQAGMIPALLRTQYNSLPHYNRIKTIMTIHNLQYQGIFGIKDVQDVLHLPANLFTDDKLEHYGSANFLKAGLVYADEITTVSPSYAQEIQTGFYGERLDGLLRAKNNHLTGILNGINTEEFNPAKDTRISATYTADNMKPKAENKLALQEQLELEVRDDVPIVGIVSRLSSQKGLDLIDYVISDIMREDLQLVVLGMGDSRYINLLNWAEQNYPGRVAARYAMDHDLAHRIYAGSDIFLMPSQFEPCGLSQMISLSYGTIPVVRETGGLRDTVLSYNEFSGEGNGFTFLNYNAHDMLHTLQRALSYYTNHPEIWEKLMKRGMRGDYSWKHSAERYIDLYEKMLTPPLLLSSANQGPEEKEIEILSSAATPIEASNPAVKAQPKKTAAKKPAVKAPAKKPAAKKSASKNSEVTKSEPKPPAVRRTKKTDI